MPEQLDAPRNYRRVKPKGSCLTCRHRCLAPPNLSYRCSLWRGPKGEAMYAYEAHLHVCDGHELDAGEGGG